MSRRSSATGRCDGQDGLVDVRASTQGRWERWGTVEGRGQRNSLACGRELRRAGRLEIGMLVRDRIAHPPRRSGGASGSVRNRTHMQACQLLTRLRCKNSTRNRPLDNPCQYSRGVSGHRLHRAVFRGRGPFGDDAHMPRLQRKSLSAPDLVRTFPFGHVDIVNLDETSVARFKWEPGWRWSKDVKPVVQTESCQNRHVGYASPGTLHVAMEDGTEVEIHAGDAFEIPPGHDAWVVGDDVWDTVEFTSAAIFGVTPDENETVLSTILFTDIVDSTATLSRVGDAAWRRLLHQHNQVDRDGARSLPRPRDGNDRGRVPGAVRRSARAVRCANAMVAAVGGLGIGIRAGLHTGEVAIAGARRAGWPSTPRRALRRSRARARSSSARRRGTCWTARACRSSAAATRAQGPRRRANDLRPGDRQDPR